MFWPENVDMTEGGNHKLGKLIVQIVLRCVNRYFGAVFKEGRTPGYLFKITPYRHQSDCSIWNIVSGFGHGNTRAVLRNWKESREKQQKWKLNPVNN